MSFFYIIDVTVLPKLGDDNDGFNASLICKYVMN